MIRTFRRCVLTALLSAAVAAVSVQAQSTAVPARPPASAQAQSTAVPSRPPASAQTQSTAVPSRPPAVEARPAAVPTLDASKSLTQYLHEAWTTNDGLPQSTVNDIAQTPDGYLWLATEEGVARFDGTGFDVFDKSNTPAFGRSHAVRRLHADRNGALWIATQGGGLIRGTKEGFRAYGAGDGWSGEAVSDIRQDDEGALWIGTYGSGLFRLDEHGLHSFTTRDGLSSDVVTALASGPSGTLFVATDRGLNQYHEGEIATADEHQASSDAHIHALLADPDGTLWIGSEKGLSRLTRDGDHERMHAADLRRGVFSLHRDREGTLWLGTDGRGIVRRRSGQIESFPDDHPLAAGRVVALFEDREGSLWIGGEGRGLSRLRDGKFTYYSTAEGLSHNMALTVSEGADGSIWVGTEGGGLNRIEDGSVTNYTVSDGLTSNRVASVYGDRDGDIWIGTLGGGLNRWRDGQISSYSMKDGLAGDAVFALSEDRAGNLWIGTNAGLARFDGHAFTSYSTEDGLSSSEITSILQSRTGDIWIGTYDGGLNRLRDGSFTSFTTADGLRSDLILALYEDAEGALWIGTYEGGLTRLKDGTFTTFTTAEGLFSDVIYQILEDGRKNLWMSSNKGIFRVRKKDLADVAAGRAETLHSTAYGRADGLKDSELNGGSQPAGWRGHDGTLWFPTVEGVTSVDPENIQRNGIPPPVVVEEVRVDQHDVPIGIDAELPPGRHKIEFRYAALSLVAPEKVQYRYKLEGYDDAWTTAGRERTASYTNLPPGTYTFHVVGSNNDGVWNERGATFSFVLKPFFYQTPWFWLLCALLLVGAAAAAHKLRMRHLRARQRELEATVAARTKDLQTAKDEIERQAQKLRELDRFKMQFFANVSHEFRTPLTMIAGPLESLLMGSHGSITGELRHQMEIMLRNAQRLTRLINQLLDLSKLEDGKMRLQAKSRNIVPFIEGVVVSCTAFAQRKGLKLQFRSESESVPVCFEPDKLEKVLFNLLSNASKFTPRGGSIDVILSEMPATEEMTEGAVRLRITDTGRGIPQEELPHIFDRFRQVDGSNTREHEGTGIGLALARELILLHRGTIDVESGVGAGTTFTIVLPKGVSHLESTEITDGKLSDEIDVDEAQRAKLASAAFEFVHDDEKAVQTVRSSADDAPCILVVDDNKDVREYVADLLDDTYRVETAADGREGLETAQDLIPDLIISDVMMPRMDGNELCRHVKSSPALNHIPVILLTARATHELKIEGLEVGADDYVPKPFSARELKVRIRNLLKLRSQERELKMFNEQLEQKVQQQFALLVRQRQRYENNLVAAKERAEASERLKSSILHNLSHEFRTPLAAIMGYSGILREEAPDDLHEFVSRIECGSQRLSNTLEALLEFSALEADVLEADAEPIEVVAASRAALEEVSSAAREKGLRAEVRASGGDEMWVYADRDAVRRILRNVLDNAVKFTSDGEIVVDVVESEDEVHVRIRDTGIGIEPDFMPHMFDAFEQESDGLSRAFEGVGLGLTIAQRLVDLTGGRIYVESEKGRGTVVTVAFSCRRPGGDSAAYRPQEGAGNLPSLDRIAAQLNPSLEHL